MEEKNKELRQEKQKIAEEFEELMEITEETSREVDNFKKEKELMESRMAIM